MSEASCHIVSSRGILKACCFHDPHPVSSNNNTYSHNIATHPIFESRQVKMPRAPTVYVCSAAISYFMTHILPSIKIPFVLVTGDSVISLPDRPLEDLNRILKNPLLRHWYSQNLILRHPKITCMPIGLDYHTRTASAYSGGLYGNHVLSDLIFQRNIKRKTPQSQDKLIMDISSRSEHFSKRNRLCFVNFGTQYPDRVDAHASISTDLIVKCPVGTKRDDVWKQQSKYSFVVSPFGMGIDCHRTWEALALGCIAIVKRSPICVVFDDLPVLIVDDWRDLNMALLNKTLDDFSKKKFNMNKLTMKYWMTKMHSH